MCFCDVIPVSIAFSFKFDEFPQLGGTRYLLLRTELANFFCKRCSIFSALQFLHFATVGLAYRSK